MSSRILSVLLLITILVGCKKEEVEENIVFELNAGSTVISTSANYDLALTLKSKMPSTGIKIEIAAVEEASTTIVPQNSAIISTTTSASIPIQNLPRQKWVVITVKATSVRTLTNTSSQTFRVIYK